METIQRRSRGSITLPWSGMADPEEPRTQAELFDDFRKRHSKQNRDIIVDNANRMAMIKSLRDEVQSLQSELFEVRRANVVLRGTMRRMKKEAYEKSESTRLAIEEILSVVPALQSLYTILSVGKHDPISKRNRLDLANYPMMGVTNATNPAANGAAAQRLGVLPEALEYGSDSDLPTIEAKKSRPVSRGRRTGMGSVAARSPIPRPRSRSRPSNSPLRPVGPEPLRAEEDVEKAEKKPRRRRESGLLEPLHTHNPPTILDAVSSDDVTKHADAAPTMTAVASVMRNVEPDMVVVQEVDNTIGEQEGVDGIVGRHVNDPVLPTPVYLPVAGDSALFSPSSTSAILDDDGGRGRRSRSRKSVNYKEPNLVKKMRKPADYSADDSLSGRQSMSHVDSMPTFDLPLSTFNPSTSLPGSHTSRPSRPPPAAHMAGTRRKSVLPKSGYPPPQAYLDDDDDAVEDALGMSLGLDMDDTRTSTPLPEVQGARTNARSRPSDIRPVAKKLPKDEQSVAPAPQSRPSAKPSQLGGLSRPTASSAARGASVSHRAASGGFGAQSRERDALAEMPSLNGRISGVGKGSSGKEGSKGTTAGMGFEANVKKATRRVSSAV